LLEQKWPGKRILTLIPQLFEEYDIVSLIDGDDISFLLRKQRIEVDEIDLRQLYVHAITSNSGELPLADRARLITDNISDSAENKIAPSSTLYATLVPTVSGNKALKEAEILDSHSLASAAIRVIAPNAVDRMTLSRQLGLSERQAVRVLLACGIQEVSSEETKERVIKHFSELWPACRTNEDRFSVLQYVRTNNIADRLSETASRLDVVLVQQGKEKWKPPIGIVSPKLLLKKLPFLAEDERPSLSVSDDIKEIWHQWCGIGTVAQAFEILAGKAKSQIDIPKASKELYDWIDQVYPPAGAEQDEFGQKLATTAWVLAKRNGIEEVKLPRDIIIHKGHDVLERHFWVPAIPLPLSSRGHEREIGFQTNLEINQYNLESVCICLSEALHAEPDGLLSIYARIADAVEEDADLRGLWTDYARQYRVFRTFRDNTPYVGSLQLFIGEVHREDLSSMLLCLCSDEGVPSKAPKLYEILGVPKQPTLKQILHALCTFEERDVSKAYRNLVDIVIRSATDEAVDYDWQNIKIRTCAGTFRLLGQSYWDPALGFRSHVQPAAAQELIDTQHGDTRRLIDWIHQYDANYPKCLRDGPGVRFSGQQAPVDVAGSIDYVLQPWRHLCAEIVRADSRANEEVANRGLSITDRPPEFSVVDRITLHSETVGGMSIDQDPKWEGPIAFADHNGKILIAAAYFPDNTDLDAGRLKDIDSYIAEEILHSLGDTCFYKPDTERVQCLLNLLERPSTVIQSLKERNRFHFIYQYQDQVADPDFTTLFDEYQKTRPSSGRHQELEEELYSILSHKFIDARREQIRGYGYEEFSVITELLQNAEDAYVQRAWLGMDTSEECEVTFRFEKQCTGRTILNVEHKGRPFNYYRHQGKEDRAFARDVEGVLRSAGSYKPHSRIDEENDDEGGSRNIGRFGLGFKSVFLLCDRPEIHSGYWHFAIENGCIPVEVPVPQNWNPSLTRITLPLNSGAEVGLEADRLARLLPFLRQTKRISIVSTDGAEETVAIKETMALESKEWVVQECFVEINSRPFLRFVRVRSGSAQMAMLIDSKNFPVRWDDFFPNDLCVFLPLKSRLGCGIGISNRFQVQSGRTHLTSSEDNEKLAINIAAILPGLTAWLSGPGYHQAKSGISAYLLRFWQIWNWNEYDAECKFVIDKIAYELWRLADKTEIVPTHDLDSAVSLSRGLCFYFVDVPVLFRQALLRDRFAVPVAEDEDIQLTAANVVPEVFVSSLRRLAEHIGCQIDDYMFRVSWEQIALACERAPWLAEKPELLNDLASCLSEDRLDDVARWVANCNVAGIDGLGKTGSWTPRQLFPRDMADADYLPTRFLQQIDGVYSEPALALLRKAGLKTQPSSDDISVWITKGQLDSKECNGLLRYLASQDRFRVFWSLRGLFCSAWIRSNGDRITTEQARRKGLLDPDVVSNNVFGAWLGLETGEVLEPPPASPRYNPEVILRKLADEWEKHGSRWVKLYNQKVYPNGLPPALLFSDAGMTTSERREWMVLLILGSLHTMGRTKPEQHRDFLMRCSRNGWLDAISEQNTDTRRWFDFIESFLDDPLGNQDYYQWVKQIVAFYQFNRWLPEYVGVLSALDRFDRPLTINDIFNPRENPDLSGSGLDAPSMRRALGMIGVHFVLRELVRLDLLEGRNVSHLCYVPARRVRTLLSTITNGGAYDSSNEIHQLLVEVLGKERATFGKTFDLPLLILTDDQKLQRDIIGKEIDFDSGEE
jgi:hypothetical protein